MTDVVVTTLLLEWKPSKGSPRRVTFLTLDLDTLRGFCSSAGRAKEPKLRQCGNVVLWFFGGGGGGNRGFGKAEEDSPKAKHQGMVMGPFF